MKPFIKKSWLFISLLVICATASAQFVSTGPSISGGSGTGDVVGPSSATDNAVVRMDGASGTQIQSSSVQLSDGGDYTGVASITINNTGLKVKDTDASHVLTIAPGSNLTANRTFTLVTGDANRTFSILGDLSFTGNVTTAAAFTTSGANALTLTTTAPTNVTLPTTGTLATLSNKVTDFTAPTSSFSMNSQKITNLLDPTGPQDAVTKSYGDALFDSRLNKNPCRLATTANLNATYLAGILTEVGNGALSVDGVTPSVNDRILVKDQTSGQYNGVYTVTDVGSGATPYILTRATDLDTSGEMLTGVYVLNTAGTTYTAAGFSLITPATITLDTTVLTFSQITTATAYVGGSGLTLTGLTFAVGSGPGITVNADSIEADFTAVQAKDATLTALSAFNTNGFVAQTAPDTFAGRTIQASAAAAKEGVVILNGDGIAGNPSIGFDLTTLTNNGTPDPANDYALIYDASSGTNQKAVLGTFTTSGVYFHQVGTTPNECWYSSAITQSTTSTIAMGVAAADSTLYAVPFIPVIGGTLDRMAFNVNVAAADTVARVGIYKNTNSAGQLYPSELLVDAGESATTTVGTKSQTISASLTPGQLYWMVFIADNTTAVATGPTIRAIPAASMPAVLGTSSAFGTAPNTYLRITGQTYGALPGTFPAGATTTTGAAPAAIVRFSS